MTSRALSYNYLIINYFIIHYNISTTIKERNTASSCRIKSANGIEKFRTLLFPSSISGFARTKSFKVKFVSKKFLLNLDSSKVSRHQVTAVVGS